MGLHFAHGDNYSIYSSIKEGHQLTRGAQNLLISKLEKNDSLLLEISSEELEILRNRVPESVESICDLYLEGKHKEVLTFNTNEKFLLTQETKQKYGITEKMLERIISLQLVLEDDFYEEMEPSEITNMLISFTDDLGINFMNIQRATNYTNKIIKEMQDMNEEIYSTQDLLQTIYKTEEYLAKIFFRDVYMQKIRDFIVNNDNPAICVKTQNFDDATSELKIPDKWPLAPIDDYMKQHDLKTKFILTE